MDIRSAGVVSHPREVVFRTLRDRLQEVAAFIPNVAEITELERLEVAPGRHEILTVWHGNAPIPAVARRFVKPEMLKWTERAVWDESGWTSDWSQETAVFTDRVRCSGQNRYVELDEATEIEIRGSLDIDLRSLPGLPGPLARRAAPAVERFIVMLIKPNLDRTVEAVSRLLNGGAAPS